MIKLKSLITEQEFKAKSKETGRVVVYKSKDSMDKAIKGGRAEPLDKKTGGKPEKVKGADLFKKDVQKKVQKKKTDTNVRVLDDDGKEITLSPEDQKIVNKHKAGQISDEELKNAGYSEMRGTYFTRYIHPKLKKDKPKSTSSPVKVSKQATKKVSDLSNEIEKNIDDAYEDLD